MPARPGLRERPRRRRGRAHPHPQLKAHAIVRLEHPLEPATPGRVDKTWTLDGLPGGKDAHPEGLVILPGGVPVVYVDSKVAGDNLVVLAAT